MSLARADRPALGLDTSIECIGPENKASRRRYEIEVQDNKDKTEDSLDRGQTYTFTTERILANRLAAGIRTRGTRVFKGTEKRPNATPVVIKDVWIDAD